MPLRMGATMAGVEGLLGLFLKTRANNVIVPLSEEGRLSVFCGQASGEVDLVLDVNGFFQ